MSIFFYLESGPGVRGPFAADDHPGLHSQLQNGLVLRVTSVSANGRAQPVSSPALGLSVRLGANSLGTQLS